MRSAGKTVRVQFDIRIYSLQLYFWEGAAVAGHVDVALSTPTMGASSTEAVLGDFLSRKACHFMLELCPPSSDHDFTRGYESRSESFNS